MEYSNSCGDTPRELRVSFAEALKVGINEARSVQKSILLGGIALAGAFEWTFGNEMLLSWAAGKSYNTAKNPLLSAAINGTVSFTEQFAFGALMTLGIRSFPRFISTLQSRYQYSASPEDSDIEEIPLIKSTSQDFATAMTFGSSALILAKNAKEKHSPLENTKLNAKTSALVAPGVAALTLAGTGVLELGQTLGLEAPAEFFVDRLTDFKTYLAAGVGILLYKNKKR